ncbi:MAG: purine-nucleoside phosphorylase [Deltaproteobacteria bacterium]|nr:purine-nucleoside phosphorylase [Candidatus Zymogenaceae bacterium]
MKRTGVSPDDVKTLGADIRRAAQYAASRTSLTPRRGVILGTGLGDFTEKIKIDVSIPYEDIPGFPISTVTGHAGVMHLGTLPGKEGDIPLVVLDGRFHLYEGYRPAQIATPIRVLKLLGVETLVITNASGGLNPNFKAGEIMLITDHINYTGHDPLIGENLDEIGGRFPDMTRAYDPEYREIAVGEAMRLGILLHRGVYIGIKGPSLETPAETRLLRSLGGDATGMSTVLEVIAAVHAGMKVLGFSIISNMNLPDCMEPILLEDILKTMKSAAPKLNELIHATLDRINTESHP